MKIVIGILLVFSCSCAHYVKKVHKYFDQHEKKPKRYSLYEKYRDKSIGKVTTGNKDFLSPGVKRYYRPKKDVVKKKDSRKRYTASDFNDNRSDGSIWLASSGRNREFLFTKNVNVRNGDIVLIQVQQKLKRDIASELKREFPLPIITPNKKTEPSKLEPTKKVEAKKLEFDDNKIFDVISSIVIDEVNNNHLIVKGEKEILFRNKKRLVEIQGLVNRQHIEPDGSLASGKIIETQVQVVRRLQ